MSENADQSIIDALSVTDDADANPEDIRNENIRHEASIRSVGTLYYLGALILIGLAVSGLLTEDDRTWMLKIFTAAFLIGFAVLQVFVGTGLLKLRHWAIVPAAILSAFGLLGFPLGTVINAYILYLIFSKKGRVVFSPGYRTIIAQTPEIKFRTSGVIWMLLVLLAVVLVSSLVMSL